MERDKTNSSSNKFENSNFRLVYVVNFRSIFFQHVIGFQFGLTMTIQMPNHFLLSKGQIEGNKLGKDIYSTPLKCLKRNTPKRNSSDFHNCNSIKCVLLLLGVLDHNYKQCSSHAEEKSISHFPDSFMVLKTNCSKFHVGPWRFFSPFLALKTHWR